jgi:acetyltransferase-like isoleucine patch superfamily enzyme
MKSVLKRAWLRLQRDAEAGVSPLALIEKSTRYAFEIATARLFLAKVDFVGQGVRTLHAPRIENHGYISIGSNTLLRSVMVPVELATAAGARLIIGDDVTINYGVSFGCTGQITVGDRCQFGPYAMIIDSQFHDIHDRSRRPPAKPVTLESDVWVGSRASIMPGVTIGRGAVVGTGAVVTRDVEPFTVVAGVPAKEVQKLDPEKFVTRLGSAFKAVP